MFDKTKVTQCIRQENLDGWLFYNFHNLDPSANAILDIPPQAHLTRRWFYFIPGQGEPVKLVHRIESNALDHLPGKKREYANWKKLHEELKDILSACRNICMQYSPMNAIPYVSYVDGGMVDLIRNTGVTLHSSANLIQIFEAVWSKEGLASHLRAAQHLLEIVHLAFAHVREKMSQTQKLLEYDLQQTIMQQFQSRGLVTDSPPIIAVKEHSGNPHYAPEAKGSYPIEKGDLLLIDLWAKENKEESIYADITWVGVVDKVCSGKYKEVFEVVRNARDAAIALVFDAFASAQPIHGYEVDDASRSVIQKAGYGDHFVHRTGHSIGKEVHWKGVNMDNFETKDERRLIDGIGFSIEPGIYLKEFGIRSEVNMYIDKGKPHISGEPIQKNLVAVLAI